MTDLFEKSIRTLELPAVLEKLAAKAVSDAAKERCLRLTPATDTQEVLHLLDETDAAKERLGLHGSPSLLRGQGCIRRPDPCRPRRYAEHP